MRMHLPSSYGFSHGRGASLYDSTKYLSPQPILEGLMPHPANPVYSHTVRKFEDDDNQISPSVVVIIIILAIIFFLSGFLHLLIRFLARTPRRGDSNYNSENDVTALQGQLQQLFHLHDSGVEQAFIDTLPAFMYKAVKGLKETTDCAVCLCEFEAEDRLRLLPKCSHAFHSDCIDTWLLSHSTCPLCRASLLPDCTDCFSSSVVVVVPSDQSGDHGSRETADGEEFREEEEPRTQNLIPSSPCSQNEENVDDSLHNLSQRTGIAIPNSSSSTGEKDDGVGKMVTIKLGKLRNIDGRGETSAGGSSNIDPRRSYSMGSYEYVLDPSNLQVFIAPIPYRKQSSTKDLPLTPGHRPNLSERMIPEQVERSIQRTPYEDIVCKSKIIKAIHSLRPKRDDVTNSYLDSDLENHGQESDMKSKGFGSQTWIRSKRVQAGSMETLDSSRRALSFRLSVGADTKLKQSASRRTLSETEIYGWVEDDEGPNPSRESSFNDISASNENCSSASTECRESVVPSFAKRTLNWLVGRQKRVAHASASPLQHRPRPDLSRSRDQSLL